MAKEKVIRKRVEPMQLGKETILNVDEYDKILLNFTIRKNKKKFKWKPSLFEKLKDKFFNKTGNDYYKRKELFEKGRDLIFEQFTYMNYLTLVSEIENLKKILFSEEQQILFKLISKPILSLKKTSQTIKKHDEIDIFNYSSLRVILNYIESLAKNTSLISEIDKKLLESLDKELSKTIADSIGLKK